MNWFITYDNGWLRHYTYEDGDYHVTSHESLEEAISVGNTH